MLRTKLKRRLKLKNLKKGLSKDTRFTKRFIWKCRNESKETKTDGEVDRMRFGIDNTKYIVKIVEAIIEREEKGQLSDYTKNNLLSYKDYLTKVIKENPE